MPASGDVPKMPAQKERPQMPGWAGFDDRPRGCGQKMANMSTVAFVVTYIFKQKGHPNGIKSR